MNKILDDYVNMQNAKPGELVSIPHELVSEMEFSRFDCMGVTVLLAVYALSWLGFGLVVGWMLWA